MMMSSIPRAALSQSDRIAREHLRKLKNESYPGLALTPGNR
jgi:hypothetical protein